MPVVTSYSKRSLLTRHKFPVSAVSRDCPVVGLLVMAIAHATAHTIIRVKTSDDAIVVQRSIRKLKCQPACSRRLWKRCLYVEYVCQW